MTQSQPVTSFTVAPIEADASLLNAARRMNKGALIKIFDRYSVDLYNYALRLCHDRLRADNIVGDVFAKFLDQLVAGRGPNTNLRSYLYQMTYHQIISEVRFSRRVAPLEVLEFLQGNGGKPPDGVENQILLDTVLLVIENELTEDQRHVIILRFLEGFNLRETAEIIGKEVNNVKVLQNRGIAKLRKLLGSEES